MSATQPPIDFRQPRVAGTILTEEFLRSPAITEPLPCGLVELRADGFPSFPGWIDAGRQIEQRGTPVMATLRLATEGGRWTGPDEERLPLFQRALENLSGVDVELQSPLAEAVAAYARQHGRFTVISHHDFTRTPPSRELEEIIRRAQEIGSVVKIAAMIQTPEDIERLRALLKTRWKRPLCLIGMGQLGRETRLEFPLEGSCLTYGYLDAAGAPGQYSAAELTEHLRNAS